MLHTILLIIHILVSFLLIIAILLQAGKGSDLGAVFGGGGSQALFGATGPMDFIKKATIVLVAVFMLNSLILGYVVKTAPTRSIMTPETKQKTEKTMPTPATKQPAVPSIPAAPQQAKPAPAPSGQPSK